MNILVINCGSSSVKFSVYDMARQVLLISGKVERIGEVGSHTVFNQHAGSQNINEQYANLQITNHKQAVECVLSYLQENNCFQNIKAIGHRVVHGGEYFSEPVVINDNVLKNIRALIPLAPLHNPANLEAIETIQKTHSELRQVAVFDTAFFHTLPQKAFHYAIPQRFYQQHHVRRYGFHGTSHQYVANQAAEFLKQSLSSLKMITLHLGNGASVAAVRNGICIDTSMGMTPLEGLVMGTRCGDLDPSIPFYLARATGMDLHEIETLLNEDSGLKGLCDVSDMREVQRLADAGDERAQLAIEMYCYRVNKYIGAYFVALQGLDVLVFTGGIGENDYRIRESICTTLNVLDVSFDRQKNRANQTDIFDISRLDSNVKVLVVPTNEELEIAQQTFQLLQ